MKKVITVAACSLLALGVNAQTEVTNIVKNLDKSLVIYTTNDTITSKIGVAEDPDTGEEIETRVDKFWTGSDMVNGFNACGLPLSGTSNTQTQYKIATRQDYVDAATGFNMPAGSYRGIFVDGTINLTGKIGEDKLQGYTNCKSVVLYFVPIPTTWVPAKGISHQDYPTGRVQAKYVTVEGVATTNQAYREIHIDMTNDSISDNSVAVIQGLKDDFAGFTRSHEHPLDVTIDRPVRLEINLQNKLDGEAYTDLFADATTKQSEYANLVCEAGKMDYEMSYYFADPKSCDPYYNNTSNPYASASASGYDCNGGKWGTKVAWTPETIVQLAVKKRMYLVGLAIVSATDGAPSQFMNASEGLDAKWTDSAKAYTASYAEGASGIHTVNEEKARVAPRKHFVNGQILIDGYNIAGQRIK